MDVTTILARFSEASHGTTRIAPHDALLLLSTWISEHSHVLTDADLRVFDSLGAVLCEIDEAERWIGKSSSVRPD